ncbi:imelysin family protein [Microbulbifer sp. 2201CG32-9]|uniref:imelysin family protein n=1 Tax=unclassified Microbulbifer TaxID=2619833 RepID=UPI00345BCD76
MIGNIWGKAGPLLFLVVGLALAACDREASPQLPDTEQKSVARLFSVEAAETLSKSIWQSGQAQLIDTQAAVNELNGAVTGLLEAPSEDHLEVARLAWLNAHRQFAAAVPYIRLGFAPATLRDEGRRLQLSVDSWPVQPGYLDTVPGYSESGIVNDTAVELTLSNLRKQHRLTAHEEASLGFHAMEVMLWGPTGERTAQQFAPVGEGQKPEARAANRRRQLTRLIGQALAEDIDELAGRWPMAANDLSRHFLSLDPAARLRQIRAIHTQVVDEELLPRLPESSESDVESGRAADSKLALLAMLATLRENWLMNNGTGLAKLLLEAPQAEALEGTFAMLEELLRNAEDPIELAEPDQLARSRELLEELAGLMSGTAEAPAAEQEVTPVSAPVQE